MLLSCLAVVSVLLVSQMANALPVTSTYPPYCFRFPEGSQLISPAGSTPTYDDLSMSLYYMHTVDALGLDRFCYYSPVSGDSPVIRVEPGENITLTLSNMANMTDAAFNQVVNFAAPPCGSNIMTPNSINLHFHGLGVTPACHGDNVVATIINPGESLAYSFQVHKDMPAGIYGYHAHVHGISEGALLGGASGVIIVEGMAKSAPSLAGLPEQILAIRDQPTEPAVANDTNKPSWDLSVNFIPIVYPRNVAPNMQLKPDEMQFFRVINLCADAILDIQVLFDGVAQPLELIALDGVVINSREGASLGVPTVVTHIRLDQLNRAEFVFKSPSHSVQVAQIVTLRIDTGPIGDYDPFRVLVNIQVNDNAPAPNYRVPNPVATIPSSNFLLNLIHAPVTQERLIYFSEVLSDPNNPAAPTDFFVTVDGATPQKYHPDIAPAVVTTQGTVEKWVVQNRATESHVFHIHQIHFLVLDNGNADSADMYQYKDVIDVPYWSGNPQDPYPSVTLLMDFSGGIVGTFVFHCHILGHEDFGMMAKIQILPAPSTTQAYPSTVVKQI